MQASRDEFYRTDPPANRLFRENRAVGNDVINAFGVWRLGGQAFRFYRSRTGA